MGIKNSNWLKVLRRWQDVILKKSEARQVLADLFEAAEPNASILTQILWLERLLFWIRNVKANENPSLRLRFCLQWLSRNEKTKAKVAETLRSILTNSSFVQLLLETGVSHESGFFSEISERILLRILPRPRENDFHEVFRQVFRESFDAEWIAKIPVEDAEEILNLIDYGSEEKSYLLNLRRSAFEALLVLGATTASRGIKIDTRRRLRFDSPFKNIFLNLNREIQNFVDLASQTENSLPSTKPLEKCLEDCFREIERREIRLENSGVSVGMVYRLDVLSQSIRRIENLLSFFKNPPRENLVGSLRDFTSELVAATLSGRRFKDHLKNNLRLLCRKICERNGSSGEHYVIEDLSTYRKMFFSAAGGGLIVVAITIVKALLAKVSIAPFYEATAIWWIYSFGFLAMQFLGFTLATKLPSFTASHLAQKLRAVKKADAIEDFVDDVTNIYRSQFIALIGNLAAVIPAVLLLEWILDRFFSIHLMSLHYARHTIDSLHPFLSFTIPLAILTGFELWLSTFCGGWMENWFVYQQIPEAIADQPTLKKLFGESRAQQFSKWLLKNSSGIGANISLGFLFGYVPLLGHIFGIPADGRHVTISSASAIFAGGALIPGGLHLSDFIFTSLGILLIGFLNFSVSFSMALSIAARACNVKKAWLKVLANAIFHKFLRSPLQFILPPPKRPSTIADSHSN